MTQRIELVHELELSCPPGDFSDLRAITTALERGDTEGQILFMPELFRWPRTYLWLRDRLLQFN